MKTFWRYVQIQLMIFVFGIVGPIFLVLFFATQPDPSMKWAYWAGLIITFGEVLLALRLTRHSLAESEPKVPTDVLIARASARLRGPRRTKG